VINRFLELGEAGLIDRREDNGDRKVNKQCLSMLKEILRDMPRALGHRRPAWTQRLLIDTMATYTGVHVSRRTMGRLLGTLGVRRGRPKPIAPCPWPKKRRQAVITAIQSLIETIRPDEVAV
jgi:hypothetical protein